MALQRRLETSEVLQDVTRGHDGSLAGRRSLRATTNYAGLRDKNVYGEASETREETSIVGATFVLDVSFDVRDAVNAILVVRKSVGGRSRIGKRSLADGEGVYRKDVLRPNGVDNVEVWCLLGVRLSI